MNPAWSLLSSLFRIDTKTLKTSLVALPDGEKYPDHAAVDSHREVWVNLVNSDQMLRYDPARPKRAQSKGWRLWRAATLFFAAMTRGI